MSNAPIIKGLENFQRLLGTKEKPEKLSDKLAEHRVELTNGIKAGQDDLKKANGELSSPQAKNFLLSSAENLSGILGNLASRGFEIIRKSSKKEGIAEGEYEGVDALAHDLGSGLKALSPEIDNFQKLQKSEDAYKKIVADNEKFIKNTGNNTIDAYVSAYQNSISEIQKGKALLPGAIANEEGKGLKKALEEKYDSLQRGFDDDIKNLEKSATSFRNIQKITGDRYGDAESFAARIKEYRKNPSPETAREIRTLEKRLSNIDDYGKQIFEGDMHASEGYAVNLLYLNLYQNVFLPAKEKYEAASEENPLRGQEVESGKELEEKAKKVKEQIEEGDRRTTLVRTIEVNISQSLPLSTAGEYEDALNAALQSYSAAQKIVNNMSDADEPLKAEQSKIILEKMSYLIDRKTIFLQKQVAAGYPGLVMFVKQAGTGKTKIVFTKEFNERPEEEKTRIKAELFAVGLQVADTIEAATCRKVMENYWAGKALYEQGDFENAQKFIKLFLNNDIKSAAFQNNKELKPDEKDYFATANEILSKTKDVLEGDKDFLEAQKLAESGKLVEAKQRLKKYIAEKGPAKPGEINFTGAAQELLIRIALLQMAEVEEKFHKVKAPPSSTPIRGGVRHNDYYDEYTRYAEAIKQLRVAIESGRYTDFTDAYNDLIKGKEKDFNADDDYNFMAAEVNLDRGKEGLLANARKFRKLFNSDSDKKREEDKGWLELSEQSFMQYFAEDLTKISTKKLTYAEFIAKFKDRPEIFARIREKVEELMRGEGLKRAYEEKVREERQRLMEIARMQNQPESVVESRLDEWKRTHPMVDESKVTEYVLRQLYNEMLPNLVVSEQQSIFAKNPDCFGNPEVRKVWEEFANMKGIHRQGTWAEPLGMSDEELAAKINQLPIDIALVMFSAGLGAVAGRMVSGAIIRASAEEIATGLIVRSGGRQFIAYAAGMVAESTVFTVSHAVMQGIRSGDLQLRPGELVREIGSNILLFGALGATGRVAHALELGKISKFAVECSTMGTLNGQFTIDDMAFLVGLKGGHLASGEVTGAGKKSREAKRAQDKAEKAESLRRERILSPRKGEGGYKIAGKELGVDTVKKSAQEKAGNDFVENMMREWDKAFNKYGSGRKEATKMGPGEPKRAPKDTAKETTTAGPSEAAKEKLAADLSKLFAENPELRKLIEKAASANGGTVDFEAIQGLFRSVRDGKQTLSPELRALIERTVTGVEGFEGFSFEAARAESAKARPLKSPRQIFEAELKKLLEANPELKKLLDKVSIDALMKGKNNYGGDIGKMKEMAEIIAAVNAKGGARAVDALISAQGIYGNDMARMKIVADIISGVSKEAGPEAVRALEEAKDVYGNNMGKMKEVADFISEYAKKNGTDAVKGLGESKKIYGDDIGKMKEIAELLSGIVKKSGKDGVETLMKLKDVYGGDMGKMRQTVEMMMKVFGKGGLGAVKALEKAGDLYGNDLAKLRICASVFITMDVELVDASVKALREVKDIYGDDMAKMKAVAELIAGVAKDGGLKGITALRKARKTYGKNLEKFKSVAQSELPPEIAVAMATLEPGEMKRLKAEEVAQRVAESAEAKRRAAADDPGNVLKQMEAALATAAEKVLRAKADGSPSLFAEIANAKELTVKVRERRAYETADDLAKTKRREADADRGNVLKGLEADTADAYAKMLKAKAEGSPSLEAERTAYGEARKNYLTRIRAAALDPSTETGRKAAETLAGLPRDKRFLTTSNGTNFPVDIRLLSSENLVRLARGEAMELSPYEIYLHERKIESEKLRREKVIARRAADEAGRTGAGNKVALEKIAKDLEKRYEDVSMEKLILGADVLNLSHDGKKIAEGFMIEYVDKQFEAFEKGLGSKISPEKLKAIKEAIIKRAMDQHIDNPIKFCSHGFDHSLRVMDSVDAIIKGNPDAVAKLMTYDINHAQAVLILRMIGIIHDLGYPDSAGLEKSLHAGTGTAVFLAQIAKPLADAMGLDLNGNPKHLDLIRNLADAVQYHGADKIEKTYKDAAETEHPLEFTHKISILVEVPGTNMTYNQEFLLTGETYEKFKGDKQSIIDYYKTRYNLDVKTVWFKDASTDRVLRRAGKTAYEGRKTDFQGAPGKKGEFMAGIEFKTSDLLTDPLVAVIRFADNLDMSGSRLSEGQSTPEITSYYERFGYERGISEGGREKPVSGALQAKLTSGTVADAVTVLPPVTVDGKPVIYEGELMVLAKNLAKTSNPGEALARLKELLDKVTICKFGPPLVAVTYRAEIIRGIENMINLSRTPPDATATKEVKEAYAKKMNKAITDPITAGILGDIDMTTMNPAEKAIFEALAKAIDDQSMRHFGGCRPIEGTSFDGRTLEVTMNADVIDKYRGAVAEEKVKLDGGTRGSLSIPINAYQIWRALESSEAGSIGDKKMAIRIKGVGGRPDFYFDPETVPDGKSVSKRFVEEYKRWETGTPPSAP